MLCLAPSCLNLFAQARSQERAPQSDLARQNMAHVAASVGQLVAVLHRDPGLMVEIKRWIAKDATDHGQLISDSDLTDEAIFDRLETDIVFRSVATALVQKYGYLQPSVNPDSPLAKEQELLTQERVKWQVQDEEAARTKARQLQEQELSQSQYCDPRIRNCPVQTNGNNPSIQQLPQQPEMNQYPTGVPGLQNPQTYPPTVPYAPPQRTPPTNDMTQLLRTSTEDPLLMEQTQPGSAFGGSSYGQNSDTEQDGSTSQRRSSGAMQPQGIGGGQREDLSMESDFECRRLESGLAWQPIWECWEQQHEPLHQRLLRDGKQYLFVRLGKQSQCALECTACARADQSESEAAKAAESLHRDPVVVRHVPAGCGATASRRAIRNAGI